MQNKYNLIFFIFLFSLSAIVLVNAEIPTVNIGSSDLTTSSEGGIPKVNILIPIPHENESIESVNNSQYLQGLTPQQVANLFVELDPFYFLNPYNYFNNTGIGLESSGTTVSANVSFFDDRYANGNLDFNLYNISSTDVVGYFIMNTSSSFNFLGYQKVYSSVTNGQLLDSWIDSNTNLTGTKSGTVIYHIHAWKSGGTMQGSIFMRLYKRNSSGEFLLSTSENSPILTSGELGYDMHGDIGQNTLNVTDKLVVKLYVNTSGVGSNPTINTNIMDNTDAGFSLPVNVGNIVLNAPPQNLTNVAWLNQSNNFNENNLTNVSYYNNNDLGNSPCLLNLNYSICANASGKYETITGGHGIRKYISGNYYVEESF